MALNTLNTRVTRHFASFFCYTTYIYTRGCKLRNHGYESPREKNKEDSHEFLNVCLTSPLAKAQLIGVFSLHSTTRHNPTYIYTRARATHIHTRIICIYTSLSLPSSLPSFPCVSLCLSLSFFHSSLSFYPLLHLIFPIFFLGFFF